MRRRELLRNLAAAGVSGVLAGCVSGRPGTDPVPTDDDTSPTPSLVDTELRSMDSDCAGRPDGEVDTASVAFDDRRVVVSGSIRTPTPCYDAAIESADYDASVDELTVTVAATELGGACAACVGVLTYEATVTFQVGMPATVTVRHAEGGTTMTVTTVDR